MTTLSLSGLYNPSDSIRPAKQMSLYELLRQLDDGSLVAPVYQRLPCWDREKKHGWIETLWKNRTTFGPICTYERNRRPAQRFVADGWQRLQTSREFYLKPEQFGHTRETAEKIARTFEITVQHAILETHSEGYEWFLKLNFGTSVTPAESLRGRVFQSAGVIDDECGTMELVRSLERLKAICSSAHDQVANPVRDTRRDHKYIRHNLVLLWRFLTRDPEPKTWACGHTTPKQAATEPQIESAVGILWGQRSFTYESLGQFERSISEVAFALRESLLLAKDDNEVHPTPLRPSEARLLLDLGLWSRYSPSCNRASWLEFSRKFIEYQRASGDFLNIIGKPTSHFNFMLGELGKIFTIAKALGVSIERPKRAAQRASFRGASRSHRLPFESNGDGPTDIESMIVNRLRGAKKKKSTGKV